MFEQIIAYIILLSGIGIFIFDYIRRLDEKFFPKNKNYKILDKDRLYTVHRNRSLLRLAGAIGFGICLFYNYNLLLLLITFYNFLPDFYFKKASKDLYIDKTVDL